jgi:hypothetical protein
VKNAHICVSIVGRNSHNAAFPINNLGDNGQRSDFFDIFSGLGLIVVNILQPIPILESGQP